MDEEEIGKVEARRVAVKTSSIVIFLVNEKGTRGQIPPGRRKPENSGCRSAIPTFIPPRSGHRYNPVQTACNRRLNRHSNRFRTRFLVHLARAV
jgi:hypothetical protein